ncbi:Zinc finger C2H2-type [Sesbania bispinosa]|nr:Zinc finger C2H2-type [Sesbania bispinosa]
MQQDQEEHVVCRDSNNYMQIIKGKRTKRQRLPSPLRLAMSTSSRSSTTENSGGFDHATTSNVDEFKNRTEEEEDMANCLILLAQGNHTQKKASNSSQQHVAASNKKAGLFLYQCKTCNRCFPSFQALGGHRASHKKPKANTEEKQTVNTSFVNDYATTISMNSDHGSPEIQEAKKPRNVLKLDLNLPAAPEDDNRESKFPFQSKEKVIVFSATSLVDCHY